MVKDHPLKIFYWESPLEYGEAEIIGMDEIADIAVIKIDPEVPTNLLNGQIVNY